MLKILENKNIILGVSGGIAAYKSVEFLRLLKRQGACVKVLMTENARRFVGSLTFEALSGQSVCSSLFQDGNNASIGHIAWAEEADAVVIAPATANIIGKIACGIADDAITTFMMAVRAPTLICPSMNTHMFTSRAVQRNIEILEQDGMIVLSPGSGDLACGTTGPGRLPEPSEILDRLEKCLRTQDMEGLRLLVTAGPTHEPIDPVRYISNPSSGKMGYEIARAAEHRGAEVILITGPTHLPDPLNVRKIGVQTAEEMAEAVFDHSKSSDIIIKAAAVSDYRPKLMSKQKIKKDQTEMTLHLVRNPDILTALGKNKKDAFLVGFAAETEDLEQNATVKLTAKKLDMIVGNIVGREGSGFEADTNSVTFYYKNGNNEMLPLMGKKEIAHLLLDRVVEQLKKLTDTKENQGRPCENG
jgi:phosphopantothenoylcysteine decarboxylase/phosphopantothenate--cysteine ligase